MSRVLDADCTANIVKIEGKPVNPVTVLSQGVKASTGVALLQNDKVTYITSNATDIKDLITKISDLVQLVSDTFTAIGTGMTGPTTAPPGSLPTSIIQLGLAKTALDLMKENLK